MSTPTSASSKEFDAFHNRLRIMTSIDFHELVDGGVIEDDDEAEWEAFRKDPYRWFIRTDDDKAQQLWLLIERRHNYKERAA